MNGKIRTMIRSAKRQDVVWRYLSNLGPTLRQVAGSSQRLAAAEKRIISELDINGIAITSIHTMGLANFKELDRSVARLVEEKAAEISNLKSESVDEATIGNKTFNLECLGSELRFDPNDPFARFALDHSLLSIANAYLRMRAKMRYYNVWYTAASNSIARESQLWHFDREDNYILKVFLYLDDVDEGAGPFTYAPGTHKKGKYRNINPEFFIEGGVRRTDDMQMKAVFHEDKWVRAVGKKGTLIFADTRGFHKGGEARTRDRLMFTCMYTSPASESKRLIVYPDDLDLSSLSPKQIRALQH